MPEPSQPVIESIAAPESSHVGKFGSQVVEFCSILCKEVAAAGLSAQKLVDEHKDRLDLNFVKEASRRLGLIQLLSQQFESGIPDIESNLSKIREAND